MNASYTNLQGLEMPPSVTDRLSLGVPLFVALLTAYYLPGLFKKDALASIPMVGEGSIGSRKKKFASGGAEGLYAEGYRRVSHHRPEHHHTTITTSSPDSLMAQVLTLHSSKMASSA